MAREFLDEIDGVRNHPGEQMRTDQVGYENDAPKPGYPQQRRGLALGQERNDGRQRILGE